MLTKWINASSVFPPCLQLGAFLLLLVWPVAHGQCPDVFGYQKDQSTQELYGYIELHNLRIGQHVKLNVELSIGVALTQNTSGSITLVKPKQETIRDIYNNQPAQFRINLPISNLLPRVFKITVNGQTICTGKKATGSFVSTITHQHMLLTQLEPVSNAFTGSQDQCGMPARVIKKRSIYGVRSERGQFPWAVPVFIDKDLSNKPKYICGSTIISKYHLVTAAHCMFDDIREFRASDLLTAPGMYDIDEFFENDIQYRDVASIIIHPDYYKDDVGNNIALMVLQQAIVYNDLVRPICLWNGSDNFEDIIGRTGLVSGWGITEHGAAKRPSYVQAKVVSNNQCQRNNGKSLEKGVFCADGQGQVPCSGDLGSGLVFKQGTQFYIRGVVSRGNLDIITLLCDTTKYVVYTDIASYRAWLLQKMDV